MTYFMRVAEDGSLTKASGVLRIAQPALSRQIRLLEEELGVTLFTRTARGMLLTEEGEYLRSAIAGPLRELDMALHNIRSMGATMAANFTLGLPPGLTDSLAMPVIQALRETFPNIRLCVVEGATGVLIDWLGRGVIDFAILEESSRNDRLTEERIATLPLVIVGPQSSPLPHHGDIPHSSALQLPLVLPSHHLGVRGAINDVAAKSHCALKISTETDSHRLIADLVAGGSGYTLMPECYLTQKLAEHALKTWSLSRPAPCIEIFLSTRENSKISGRQFSEVTKMISDVAKRQLN
nr:LysR family transcriptional regulator [Aestuariicella hydrocarbonica]